MRVPLKRRKLLGYGILLFTVCVLAGQLDLKSSSPQRQDAMQYQNTQEPMIHLSSPMCQTGFTVAQRFDQRNAAGIIIKSVWVRKCVRVPKVIYGGKS